MRPPARDRVDRITLAGRASVSAEVVAAIERESNGLEQKMMSGGAMALRALAAAAIEARGGADAAWVERLARVWMDASICESAGTASILRAT